MGLSHATLYVEGIRALAPTLPASALPAMVRAGREAWGRRPLPGLGDVLFALFGLVPVEPALNEPPVNYMHVLGVAEVLASMAKDSRYPESLRIHFMQVLRAMYDTALLYSPASNEPTQKDGKNV